MDKSDGFQNRDSQLLRGGMGIIGSSGGFAAVGSQLVAGSRGTLLRRLGEKLLLNESLLRQVLVLIEVICL